MRVTLGKLVRKYVYDVRLGERKVMAVYHGDKLIWPTLRDTVYSAVLDTGAVEDALAGAQFYHALEAVRSKGAAQDCHILLTAGGRDYMLAAGFGRYDVAVWDGHATVTFGDNGPLAGALRPGDEVTLRLVVPERATPKAASPGENVGFSETWATRWLPGTTLVYSHYKGQKKVCAWANGTLTAEPSGMTYIVAPSHIHEGHKRLSHLPHTCKPAPDLQPSYADRRFTVSMRVGGSSGINYCYMQFPPFAATIRLRVSAVTLHD